METTVLNALIGGVVLVIGYLLSRRGAKEANKQQIAANVLAEREADWKRRGDAISDLERMLGAKDKRIAHLLDVCTKAQAASLDTIATLKAFLRDEVAREIAEAETQRALRHEREEH